VEFIDLKSQYRKIENDVKRRIANVLEHNKYIMGDEIFELENKLAEFVGVKHCIGVSSGTDALLIAMMALGIKPGDEVITTPFTFVATAEIIALLGAKPVFVDINPRTYNIDITKIEKAITDKTKLIIPVNLYGQCADYGAINAIAQKYNLFVIEDAAQSFGAIYKGKKSCNLSTVACTSFFPSKPLGCYGDGGACFTNDDELAKIMQEIRIHGQERRYHHTRIGINGRLDTIQAAILLAKLKIFPEEIKLREKIGQRYTELLKDFVVTPYVEPHNTHIYAQYTIQVKNRDLVRKKLQEFDIPTAVHYPVPLHKQKPFLQKCDCSVAEDLSAKVLSLPFSSGLDEQQQNFIVEKLTEIF
jgi:UDP-2-acetamido-2-deoxy-ribo-hexuluronate aminotransferase